MAIGYNFLGSLRQYDATRPGKPITDRAMRNLLYSQALADRDTSLRSQQLDLQRTQLGMQQKAYSDQSKAARVTGAMDMIKLPIQSYLGYKQIMGTGAKAATTAQGGMATTAQGAVAPVAAPTVPTAATSAGALSTVGEGAALSSLVSPLAVGFGTAGLLKQYQGRGIPPAKNIFGNVAAGAAGGFAAGSIVPGVGNVLGGILGAFGGFAKSLF